MKAFGLEARLNVFGGGRRFHHLRGAFPQYLLQIVIKLHSVAFAQVLLGQANLLGDHHLVALKQADPCGAGMH